MNPSAYPAAKLSEVDRKNLVILALAGMTTVSELAARHGVSRKFVYQQTNKASVALDEVFASSTPDDEVLFELAVTKTWLHQLTLSLTLICHSSYRSVVELMRDLLGVSISEGTVHNVHQTALGRPKQSTGTRIYREFASACMTKSSRVPSPCSPASTPVRPTATSLLRSTVAMPTPSVNFRHQGAISFSA